MDDADLSKSQRIDLGLEILDATRKPGERYTLEQIAAFCDCTHEAIRVIEEKALEKMRRRLKQADIGTVDALSGTDL